MFQLHAQSRLILISCLAAVVLLACSFADLGAAGWWALRLGTLAFGGLVLARLPWRRRGLSPVLLPPIILAGLALLFYSLLPALYVQFYLGGPTAIPPGDDANAVFGPGLLVSYEMAVRAVGSAAERLILRFVVLCLLAGQITALARPVQPGALRTSLDLIMLAGLGAGLVSVLRFVPGWAVERHAPQLFAVLPAVEMACLSLLTLAVMERRHGAGWRMAVLVITALAGFIPFGGKVMGLGVPLCCLAVLAGAASPRLRLLAGGTLLLIPIMTAFVVGVQRQSISIRPNLERFVHQMEMKLVYRQAETVYCLEFARRSPGDGNPAYALLGLVPRAVWPGKPDLSQGGRYASQYCGWSAEDVATTRHSASITLLGEPLIQAGGLGLAVALAAIVAITVWAGWAMMAGGAFGALALALMPWIVDFDQLFALWLANLGKFGLVAAAVIWGLGRLRFNAVPGPSSKD